MAPIEGGFGRHFARTEIRRVHDHADAGASGIEWNEPEPVIPRAHQPRKAGVAAVIALGMVEMGKT